MPRALVTGGAGFIGSHLVDALLERNWEVVVVDNLANGSLDNLRHRLLEVPVHQVDIRNLEALHTLFRGVEVVFHTAALGSVPRSINDPLTTHQANVDGTLNVLLAARQAGARRIIFSASSSAYGNTPTLPKHEGQPSTPMSPYAVSKYVGELYLKTFCDLYGLEGFSLRYFNIFGPRQRPDSQYAAVVPKFIDAMLRGERPVIYGDGSASRDFTFVANAVSANLLAAEAPNARGQVVNIACGVRYTILDLIQALNRILGSAIEPVYQPERRGDVLHSLASVELAGQLLGYRPIVEFEAGLQKTVEFFLK